MPARSCGSGCSSLSTRTPSRPMPTARRGASTRQLGRGRSMRGLPVGHAERRPTPARPSSEPPTIAAKHPLAAAGLHRDERPLGREHHAEDQQHQRAADVDHQLHRADEIGPGQEEQPGGRRQREHQVERHPHDVAASAPRPRQTRRRSARTAGRRTTCQLIGHPSRYLIRSSRCRLRPSGVASWRPTRLAAGLAAGTAVHRPTLANVSAACGLARNSPSGQRVRATTSRPENITAAIGMQYFKQVVITWSIRSRGSVQRTHIITVTPTTPLTMKLTHAEQVADDSRTNGSVLERQAEPVRRSESARSSRRRTGSPPAR